MVFGSLTRWWVAYNHPTGSIFATYIPLIFLANWVIICYRSHLVREPGISISPSRGTGGGLFWENRPVPKTHQTLCAKIPEETRAAAVKKKPKELDVERFPKIWFLTKRLPGKPSVPFF